MYMYIYNVRRGVSATRAPACASGDSPTTCWGRPARPSTCWNCWFCADAGGNDVSVNEGNERYVCVRRLLAPIWRTLLLVRLWLITTIIMIVIVLLIY